MLASTTHLQQVFVNLVNNAVDAWRQPDGRVEIRSWLDGGMIRADVVDNGAGILPENLPSIFLPFFTTAGE
jgi:C4-dicarboxylate-specific signal transduction histidine kinase